MFIFKAKISIWSLVTPGVVSRNCSFRAIFRPKNILYAPGKLSSEQPDVFFCFSCIFGCELTVFSVNLDTEPWNLEFFWWTKNEVRENQKNSRFQGEVSRWTEKNVREQPKIKEKLKTNSGCSLHCFTGAYKIIFRPENGSDGTFWGEGLR